MDIYFFYLIIIFSIIIGYLWNINNYYKCLILDLSNNKKRLQTIISNKNTEITELSGNLLKTVQEYKEMETMRNAGEEPSSAAQLQRALGGGRVQRGGVHALARPRRRRRALCAPRRRRHRGETAPR